MKKIKIIGAGISGLTLARLFADNQQNVEVLDSRGFIGGNCKCHFENEIEVHNYGPHIFHTSNLDVINFIKRFTSFNSFHLNIIANTNEGKYFLPFGLTLLNSFFNVDLLPGEVDAFLDAKRVKNENPKNLEEKALSLVGTQIYETFIKGYTKKQWGTDPKNLPASIIERLPFRKTYDINYYNDVYCGIPLDGYQEMFSNIANSEYIHLNLFSEYSLENYRDDEIVFFTGQIDKLFDYKFGVLPWRSLTFDYERLTIPNYQGVAVMNFPSENIPYTRRYEFKWFHPDWKYSIDETIICREYPKTFNVGDEPYYPIETEENRMLWQKYIDYAKEKYPNIVFCGRLAQYSYLDMDDAIANSLNVYNNYVN